MQKSTFRQERPIKYGLKPDVWIWEEILREAERVSGEVKKNKKIRNFFVR